MRTKFQLALAATSLLFVLAPGPAVAQDDVVRIAAMDEASSGAAGQQSSVFERATQKLRAGDFAGGLQLLTEAANAGDFEAQATLGLAYIGRPSFLVPFDFESARFWLQEAAAQKDKTAASSLEQNLIDIATLIGDGKLVPPEPGTVYDDYEPDLEYDEGNLEAVKWFEIAAGLGNREALIAIGDLYGEGGHGLSQDFLMALKYYKRAEAIESTPLVAHRIGSHYAKGLGVNCNDATAAKWFKQSAGEFPEAELWLAKYEIDRNDLRSAMNWLDRFYLKRDANPPLLDTYDAILHLYYEAMLPPAPAGWTAQKIEHQTTPERIKAAHFTSSDVAYPIIIQRRYKDAATGREFAVRILLNDFDRADSAKKQIEEARRLSVNAQREKNDSDSAAVDEFRTAISSMYVQLGDYAAFNTTIRTSDANEGLIEVPLNSHIVVRAETINGNADNPEEVEALKAVLRATKLDFIKTAADGHGVYKKNEYGELYKP